MRKIVIGTAFRLSNLAMRKLAKLKGIKIYPEKRYNDYIMWTVPKTERLKCPTDDETSTAEMIEYYDYLFAHSLRSSVDKIKRDDPDLISVVEELGRKACGHGSHVYVVEIPDDVDWEICSDDEFGVERVEEKHRVWR